MSDTYTPTTEFIRARFSVTQTLGHVERYGEQFDRWLAAHDAQVREEGMKAMREAAAQVAETFVPWVQSGEPQFDASRLMAGNTKSARERVAAAIRALPIPSTGAENTDSDEKEGQR